MIKIPSSAKKYSRNKFSLSFDIELRTIDSRNNWVFSLSGFHSQVTIGKDVILEDSIVKNQSSSQTEDLLRKIFSYYKTPILLNEIFN